MTHNIQPAEFLSDVGMGGGGGLETRCPSLPFLLVHLLTLSYSAGQVN